MGFSETKIAFMVIDKSPIVVESASTEKYFKNKTIEELARTTGYNGNFSSTSKGTFIYRLKNGDFVEFRLKLSPEMSPAHFNNFTGMEIKKILTKYSAENLELELK